MKKIVALVMALALVLAATSAMAVNVDRLPLNAGTATIAPPDWIQAHQDYVPNGDGTHRDDWWQVTNCEYNEVTVGDTYVKMCPVCGDTLITVDLYVMQEQLDEEGNVVLDENGEPVMEKVRAIDMEKVQEALLDENGEPVMEAVLDENGEAVVDENGEPVMQVVLVDVLDENGEPVMQPVLDENGNPVLSVYVETSVTSRNTKAMVDCVKVLDILAGVPEGCQKGAPYIMTNGQWMVRIASLDYSVLTKKGYAAEADIKHVVSICHEILGKTYDAEGTYSYTLPLDGRGCTVTKAYFGNEWDFKGEVRVTNSGLYIKPYAEEDAFGMFIVK